jgi:ribosomal protein S17
VLKYRGSSTTGNGVIISLKNTAGAVVRSETQMFTPTYTEYTITLTSGEIAAITSGALSVILESV